MNEARIEIPPDVIRLLQDPEQMKRIFALARALERCEIIIDGRRVPIRFSEDNAIFDLRTAEQLS